MEISLIGNGSKPLFLLLGLGTVKSDTCNIQIHFLSVSNRKIKKNVPVYKVCQAGYHDAGSGNSMILTMVEKAQHYLTTPNISPILETTHQSQNLQMECNNNWGRNDLG
jgi:hypothetical protein